MSRRYLSPASLALSQIVAEGSAFLRNLILARLIGAEQMGLAIALALGIRMIEMIGDFGLERWLVQVRPHELRRVRGAVHLLQAAKACMLMGLAFFIAAPLVAALRPELNPAIFALAAVAIGIRGFVNCEYRERQRSGDFFATLQVEGISNAVSLLAIAPIAMAIRDYSALAWASVIQAATLCLMSHAIATRGIVFNYHVATIKRALRFGLPIACNGALMFLAMQGDRMIVAVHFDLGLLAAFAIAAQLTLLPAIAGARFLLTLDLPRFSRDIVCGESWPADFRKRFLQVSGVAALLALGLSVLGNAFIGLLYGPEFLVEPIVLALLAVAAAIRLIRAVPNTLLMAAGRTAVLLACNLPRIAALLVALLAVINGAGLALVAGIGAVSEAISLACGLVAVSEMGRKRSGFKQLPMGAS
jgi:O-antigen/teichoic acid export membrane protein